MMVTNINEYMSAAVWGAVKKFKAGIDTDYAVALCWTPTPPTGMRLAWNVTLVQKSPIIGQQNVDVIIMAQPFPDDAYIEQSIIEGLLRLSEMRAKDLSFGNGQQP